MVRAVVGLGNPGRKYRNNRHNLGYLVADYICEKRRGNFKKKDSVYQLAEVALAGQKIRIVKPLTYMNESGEAVKSFCDEFDTEAAEILVLSDDSNLPLGKIRIRASGSDGGHKGLRSIISCLNTQDFPRLRLGIGFSPPGLPLEDYVLKDFTDEEISSAKEMVLRAYRAVQEVVGSSLEEAMSIYNRDPEDVELTQ